VCGGGWGGALKKEKKINGNETPANWSNLSRAVQKGHKRENQAAEYEARRRTKKSLRALWPWFGCVKICGDGLENGAQGKKTSENKKESGKWAKHVL